MRIDIKRVRCLAVRFLRIDMYYKQLYAELGLPDGVERKLAEMRVSVDLLEFCGIISESQAARLRNVIFYGNVNHKPRIKDKKNGKDHGKRL